MSFLGRRVTGDLGWNTRQRMFVMVALALVLCHACVIPFSLYAKVYEGAALEAFVVAFMLFAIFTGLPRAAGADEPSAAKGVYRAGPPAPAIEGRVTHTFMEAVIVLFVMLHVAALVLSIIAAIGMLLLVGLVIATCSRH